MNEEKTSEGLGGSQESSSKEELFSGSLESPEEVQTTGSESPQGASPVESEDSELAGIFTDLEKDIPEELNSRARKVKSKIQGYFTKKNQSIADERKKLSEEVESLKKNQITDEIKSSYSTLYGWYDKIQQNPQQGLKELASQLGISVKQLVEASEASQPQKDELTLDFVKSNPTAENWAAFTRQEVRNALQELREKEVKPLQETLTRFQGNTEKQENFQHGAYILEEASKLPGFLDESKKGNILERLTEDALKAIQAATKGEYGNHPNALKNAFKAISAESALSKARKLESELNDFKKNLAGASNPPGKNQRTTTAPSRPEDLWSDLRSEPLS